MKDAREEDDLERQRDRCVDDEDGDDQQAGQLGVERRKDWVDVAEPDGRSEEVRRGCRVSATKQNGEGTGETDKNQPEVAAPMKTSTQRRMGTGIMHSSVMGMYVNMASEIPNEKRPEISVRDCRGERRIERRTTVDRPRLYQTPLDIPSSDPTNETPDQSRPTEAVRVDERGRERDLADVL